MLNDSEFATLRKRFQKNAELLMQTGASSPDEDKKYSEEKDVRPVPPINKHSVFWVVAAIGVTYYADFFHNIIANDDIKSWWFNVGLLLLAISLCLAMFCIGYLEWFRGIVHYDQEYPAIPPITTAAFIAASCSFNIALWPVWSFFTPLILLTQFMGVVMLISMLG
ncbi:transmembrane protein 128 [Syngnathus acus]|uniref:transmembrane protein 128 n=1 Tax=Syngnathus acus TaxID=161584 RepID=UPI00188634F1|nr:transmembrane protein 128 [Syngnathus acus]XP_061148177.1 transmembrane protein 128 [Syngnathus typhle]XP_061148178.1 transmembrane protein 128 [Syngnathus typhle]XP_061148179.1 transmembrane protein 128 [Syngnathus typhle]